MTRIPISIVNRLLGNWWVAVLIIPMIFIASLADAHRSGCHRWHNCPSDRGTYVCGDTGYCAQCPDNQFCQNGTPKTTASQPTPAIENATPKSSTVPKKTELSTPHPTTSNIRKIIEEQNNKAEKSIVCGMTEAEVKEIMGDPRGTGYLPYTLIYGTTEVRFQDGIVSTLYSRASQKFWCP